MFSPYTSRVVAALFPHSEMQYSLGCPAINKIMVSQYDQAKFDMACHLVSQYRQYFGFHGSRATHLCQFLCVVCTGLSICQVDWETWLNSASSCGISSCHLILPWRGSPSSWTSFSGEHQLIHALKHTESMVHLIMWYGAHFRHPLSQVQRL